MNNRELAEAILKEVGGAQNIHSYANCMTRLRLQLKDESKANRTALNELAGVLGTQQQGNQFQIILGGKVLKVANEFNELVPMNNEENVEVEEKEGRHFQCFEYLVVDFNACIATDYCGRSAQGIDLHGDQFWLGKRKWRYNHLF